MRKITFTIIFAAMALFSTFMVGQVEGPDFPNTGLGPIFTLQAGTNTFSGTIQTPDDGQDRFQVKLGSEQAITSISGAIGGTSWIGVNGTAATDLINPPGGSLSELPYWTSAGTYSVLVNTNFSVGNGWSLTIEVTGEPDGSEPPELDCTVVNGIRDTDTGVCGYTAVGSEFDPAASDDEAVVTLINDFNEGTSLEGATFPVGTTTVMWTVTDADGQSDTCSVDIVINDNEAPVAVCQSVTVQLDEDGNASISVSDVNGESSDACGLGSISASPSSFTTANIGENSVTVTVTDINGNTDTCIATVTVEPFPVIDTIWLEAECATALGADWTLVDDLTASKAQYISAPAGTNLLSAPTNADEIVSYSFSADEGMYNVHALVQASASSDDSIWVRVNNGTWIRWNKITNSPTFVWDQVHDSDNDEQPVTFNLVDGTNTLDFGMREDGLSLDKIFITSTENLPSGLGDMASNCDFVSLPPVANAGIDQNIMLPTNMVILTGTGNDLDGGELVSYKWTQEDGPSMATLSGEVSMELTASNLEVGTYVFRLAVKDNEGDNGFDDVSVTVAPASIDEIWIEAECADGTTNWTFTLSEMASQGWYITTPEGSNLNAAPTNLDEYATFSFQADAGAYSVHALVQADTGADDSLWVRANGGMWIRWNKITNSSTFVWDQVHDSDNGEQPVTFNLIAGMNSIDFAMREDGASLDKIYITSTSNLPSGLGEMVMGCIDIASPPTADAGEDQEIMLPMNSVVLNGNGTDLFGGTIVGYSWSQEDGPSMATLSGASTADLTASNLDEGTYVFQLRVTDNDDQTGFDEVIVTVGAEAINEIWLEAECASVGDNWSVVNSETASNNQYVLTPSGNNLNAAPTSNDDYVSFSFLADAGAYSVHALVQAETSADDSFWVRANDGVWIRWNKVTNSETFVWDQVHDSDNGSLPVVFNLVDGENNIDIAMREDDASLDKIYVTSTSSLPEGLGGTDNTCLPSDDIFLIVGSANQAMLAPNPAISSATISFDEPVQIRQIYVYDVLGRLVKTFTPSSSQRVLSEELSIQDIPAGTYFVRTIDENGQSYQEQMLINN